MRLAIHRRCEGSARAGEGDCAARCFRFRSGAHRGHANQRQRRFHTANLAGGLNPATGTRILQGAVGDVDEAGDRFGGSDAAGGSTLAFADLDKDGQLDLLIGTPKESAETAGTGLLSVRYGLRVGISALSPQQARTTAGERITYSLEWKHPDRWRVLDTLHLRLANAEGTAMWLRFRERGEDLMLGLQMDDGTFAEGRAGEARVLTTTGGSLDLARSKVTGSGPDGRTVSLELAVIPTRAPVARRSMSSSSPPTISVTLKASRRRARSASIAPSTRMDRAARWARLLRGR